MRNLIFIIWLCLIVGAIMSDEVEWLTAQLSRRKEEKARLKAKQYNIDEDFIKKAAYDELHRKCKEETSNGQSPYLSIEEIEKVVERLKNRS